MKSFFLLKTSRLGGGAKQATFSLWGGGGMALNAPPPPDPPVLLQKAANDVSAKFCYVVTKVLPSRINLD